MEIVRDVTQDGFVAAVIPPAGYYLPSCWSPTSNRRVMRAASSSFSRAAVSPRSLICWLRHPSPRSYSLRPQPVKSLAKFPLTSFGERSSRQCWFPRAPEPLWHKCKLQSHGICKALALDYRLSSSWGRWSLPF